MNDKTNDFPKKIYLSPLVSGQGKHIDARWRTEPRHEWDIEYVLSEEIDQYKQWINDLQSGMYINCVYCGHRYGPSESMPFAMADVLKEHILQCPEHPMSHLINALKEAEQFIENGIEAGCIYVPDSPDSARNTLPKIKAAIAMTKRKHNGR